MQDPDAILARVLAQFPAYPREAYGLVFEGLKWFQDHSEVRRHVSAGELYEAMARASVEFWGNMAGMVVAETLNIKSGADVKFLVETMINNTLLTRGEDDRMEAFDFIKISFQDACDRAFAQSLEENPPQILV